MRQDVLFLYKLAESKNAVITPHMHFQTTMIWRAYSSERTEVGCCVSSAVISAIALFDSVWPDAETDSFRKPKVQAAADADSNISLFLLTYCDDSPT